MRRLIDFIIQNFLYLLPPTKFFNLRNSFYRYLGHIIEADVKLCGHSWIYGRGIIHIGSNTWLSPNYKIYTTQSASVYIGDNCDIGHQVTIITGTHAISNEIRRAGAPIEKDVVIGNGVWIGACVTILPGVELGAHSVIAAGSVVYKNVPENCLYKSSTAQTLEKYDPIN